VRRLLLLCSICFGLTIWSWGQTPRAGNPFSNLRYKTISAKAAIVQLDTVSLIPKSVAIAGLDTSFYTVDYINAILTWKQMPGIDSVRIQYRVFATRLNAITKRFTYDSVMNNFYAQPYVFNDNSPLQNDRFFDFGSVDYNGSFGRGISFGNAQDAVVTSSLNLQINGYLADSIEIAAAITDNNIPI